MTGPLLYSSVLQPQRLQKRKVDLRDASAPTTLAKPQLKMLLLRRWDSSPRQDLSLQNAIAVAMLIPVTMVDPVSVISFLAMGLHSANETFYSWLGVFETVRDRSRISRTATRE